MKASSDRVNALLKRCKTLDEAMTVTALYLGEVEEAEVAKLMVLARHNLSSDIDFAKRMGQLSPQKQHSISINHSRFNKLISSSNNDEFLANLSICLGAIKYDCSKSSVEKIIDAFFRQDEYSRDKLNRWDVKLASRFYRYQAQDKAV